MLIPRLGSPARDEASARSIVAGLIRATRSIVSADTWRKACQWRKRSRSRRASSRRGPAGEPAGEGTVVPQPAGMYAAIADGAEGPAGWAGLAEAVVPPAGE